MAKNPLARPKSAGAQLRAALRTKKQKALNLTMYVALGVFFVCGMLAAVIPEPSFTAAYLIIACGAVSILTAAWAAISSTVEGKALRASMRRIEANGGEEAALFGAMLLRMYQHYAERRGWRFELTDANMTELGGVKEATIMISGRGAFRRLKFESGVHRVQRVPTTESGGRIHTSTATVAVLPEAEDVEVQINPGDLRIDVYRSTGHGGQCINTTDSAVRITHLPTGLVVTCQDEKSQLKNREKAMRVLKARLYDMYQSKADAEYAENRRSQVGTGDRSERIRTYNFPQGRVTDHRIGLTLYQLESFVDGDCDPVIDALVLADETERLKALGENE